MYSVIDPDHMSKWEKVRFTLSSIILLVGGAAWIALSIYMIIKGCIG